MPPRKRAKKKNSHEEERMSTQAQARSPEVELKTRDSTEPAGSWGEGVGGEFVQDFCPL